MKSTIRRDELGRLLHVLRLPDLDSADGSEADHDVVCRGERSEFGGWTWFGEGIHRIHIPIQCEAPKIAKLVQITQITMA